MEQLTEQRTPEAERNALEALVHSDGWAVVKDTVMAAYGPEAFERAFDAAMKELEPGDEPGQRVVALQVRASYMAARDVIALVESRLAMLQTAKAKATPSAVFAGFRRGPKR